MPPFAPRKLLVAVVGAAAVNLACSKNPPTAGNLRAPDPEPSAMPPTSGNLMAPPPTATPEPPASIDIPPPPTGGNLMARPPQAWEDAGKPDAAPPRVPRPPTGGNLMAPRPKPNPLDMKVKE